MSNKIEMYKGSSEDFEVVVTDQDDNPVPITNAEVIMSVKAKFEDDEYIFQRKNTAAGGDDTQIEMTDPDEGVCEIHLVPSNTSGIEIASNVLYTTFVYDVWVKLTSGKEKHVIVDRLFLYKVVK